MRHHLDVCAVFRGVLVVEGWSEKGPPKVLYKNREIGATSDKTIRTDVAAHFGRGSESWGFRTRAIIPGNGAEHARLSLLFKDGTRLDAPGAKFRSPQDSGFGQMLQTFSAETAKGGRLLEIGSRARSGSTYRHLFSPTVEYVGMDIAEGPNVDVVGDAHHLSRRVPGTFDFVFSISVFEHLLMPWMAALEMNKVMRDGGLAYIQSHPSWPLHEQPWDFWRYSKEAWKGLFNAHTGFELVDSGYAMQCLVVPDFAQGGHLQGLDTAPSFLLSACLVRKTGPAQVEWRAEAGDVYDLAYSH